MEMAMSTVSRPFLRTAGRTAPRHRYAPTASSEPAPWPIRIKSFNLVGTNHHVQFCDAGVKMGRDAFCEFLADPVLFESLPRMES